MTRATVSASGPGRTTLSLDAVALGYVGLPVVLFLWGWIVAPLGPIAASALVVALVLVLRRNPTRGAVPTLALGTIAVVVATAWCVLAGIGHLVYANSDWWVRDAVLVDLVRGAWPVRYGGEHDLILRTPIGYYLPAALVGKLFGVDVAGLALLAWSALGVTLVFVFLVRDRPSLPAACIRIGVFVFFSGMDILPILGRDYPHRIGTILEWWARFIQYPSQTTALFWAPNHTLPGWIAAAWLLSQDLRAVPIERANLLVVLTPIWAPLTALGIAPFVVALIVRRALSDGAAATLRTLLDWRVLVVTLLCLLLVYPYLVAGSGEIPAGFMADIPWVGEEYPARYVEFVLVEFACVAALLAWRQPRDLLLWVAIVLLFLLPIVYFGPYNDLAMHTSCAALALLSIRAGRWLSTPRLATERVGLRVAVVVLLAVGAVTPFMELARPFLTARWPMNTTASVPDVTQGTHYLTPADQPWLRRFLRPASAS